MNRDPQFGPLLMFGLGGIFVEVLEDTLSASLPSARPRRTRCSMTSTLRRCYAVLGAATPLTRPRLVETIQRLSQLVTDFPAIVELDINPLVATPDGVQAVDVRLTVDPEQL